MRQANHDRKQELTSWIIKAKQERSRQGFVFLKRYSLRLDGLEKLMASYQLELIGRRCAQVRSLVRGQYEMRQDTQVNRH